MDKREFQVRINDLLSTDVNDLEWDEKVAIVRRRLVEAEKKLGFNADKKGQPWTDDELRLVLKTAPTIDNIMLLARTFRRGYGSIEQIFRWAAERSSIEEKRPNDAFAKQIKRIAKEIGWRAT